MRESTSCQRERRVCYTPRFDQRAKALRRNKLTREQVEQALLWGRLSAEDGSPVD